MTASTSSQTSPFNIPLTPSSEIDHGMFVLNVDLWNEHGAKEQNVVRHSAPSPAISSTTITGYTDVSQASTAYTNNVNSMRSEAPSTPFKFEAGQNQGSPFQPQAQTQAPAQSSYSPYPGPPQQVNSYPQSPSQLSYGEMYPQGFSPHPQMINAPGFPQNSYQGGVPIYYSAGAGIHGQAQGVQPGMDYSMVPQPLMGAPGLIPYDGLPYQPSVQEPQRMQIAPSHPGGMFNRNLIGSLAASAFRLTDPDDKIGIWFVLQDLSVRTEGRFRYGPSTPQI